MQNEIHGSEIHGPEIHCSACAARLRPGSRLCPGCGLQLTAIAQPALYVEQPRFPLWGVVLVCLVAFFIGANILSRYNDARAVNFAAAIHNGSLNTAAAFEARCGMPRGTKTVSIPGEAAQGEELHYRNGAEDLFVTLSGAPPVLQSEQTSQRQPYRINLDPADAFHRLGCR